MCETVDCTRSTMTAVACGVWRHDSRNVGGRADAGVAETVVARSLASVLVAIGTVADSGGLLVRKHGAADRVKVNWRWVVLLFVSPCTLFSLNSTTAMQLMIDTIALRVQGA